MNAAIKKLPITVIIAAKNEEANIKKCLRALPYAEKIILLDSNSVDQTAAIAKRYGAEVVQFSYKGGYPKKRQWALDNLHITTEWVFLIDADEVIPESLWLEINTALQQPDIQSIDAFVIEKGFHFMGKKFKYGGFSHKAILLFRKGKARFEHIINDPAAFQDMEVHERLIVNGKISALYTPLIHEDYKGLSAYIDRHNAYSTWEASVRFYYLTSGTYGESTIFPNLFGNVQERRRYLKLLAVSVPLEPLWWFLYHYIFKLGFLEGKRGLIASQIRYSYIAQVRSKIYEFKLKARDSRYYTPVLVVDLN